LLVDIGGAVHNPGVYELPVDCRVKDAVDAAGGLLPDAARDGVNLAARLKDGEKLIIPKIGTPLVYPQQAAPDSQQMGSLSTETNSGPAGPININTATIEQLDSLPGIGPGIAAQIIEYRESHGLFTKIEQIQNVSGIGESRFEQIKDLLIVE
jgi:competence protein ComEA